ncbi:fungal-specific transcription factor domain-containing protein [Exophiala viscosa]|uniref:Fungal-specific transcription factor domain-containing protein n=1 Tax=Exophiala viscosa TaxID=2486360 RepID=A0AAN6IGR3_9EURO|nr:fungal-specific transcription factor domain-containing protein [Exophiala viscosa]KAI1629505.1 fungal-specific transcription factor domain-containing protein [Exophiala viscosa]
MVSSLTPSESSPVPNGHGEKRKADGDAGSDRQTHTRSKRNRYISIACNECKRRKIKCNGQAPCQRCGNLSLECVYAPNCCTNSLKDSAEFNQMRDEITTLQMQVNELFTSLSELRSRPETAYPPPIDPLVSQDASNRSLPMSVSRTLPPLISPKRAPSRALPQFHGPTSTLYGIDVAKSSLQTMGITQNAADDGMISRDRSRAASPVFPVTPHPSKDPLWLIDHAEVIRLLRVYEEEIGIMYPVVDIEKVIKHADSLYKFIQASLRAGFGNLALPGADAIDDEETTVLKMILAVTMTVEGHGRSDFGQRFFDAAKPAVDLKLVTALDTKSVVLVVLTATFYFQKDEEAQAWRFIGIAARMCIEMGLHRKDSLVKTFTNEAEYQQAVRIFWTVYALDRRWSFGTGMPFALQDADIDSNLPEPDESHLYLRHITKYNQIATKVWYHNLAYEAGQNTKKDEIGFLDYQILQWYQQLPEPLQFNSRDLVAENEVPGRGVRRLRLLMYLRRNQARISIYRPILHSATSIMENRHYAQNVADVAKDTINTLTGVNQISDIYKTQQVMYNYFLVQALAVLFLSVAHAPAVFCSQTRQEFYAAIEMVKGFSTKSHVSKRIWKTIRGLKEMGDKIGLLARGNNTLNDAEQDAHSDAAVAMAGLAGHQVEYSSFANQPQGGELGVSPDDALQITNELSSLFELAGGYGATTPIPDTFNFNGDLNLGEGFNAFGNEPELSRIMNELF